MRIYLEFDLRRIDCRGCQGVKQEKLDWLADNPFYTKRFAFYIGRRCRSSSIQDVAKEHFLDWRTVKTLEMQYMREQIKRAGQPRPKVIGIDEISIRKGQTYRIVVTDLDRRRAIWFGGKDRSEESMDGFFAFLGERSSKRVRLAVMDMWKPFRKSTNKKAPQAAILFDKFHILMHLGDALDKVRKQEYAKLDGEKRKFIKGQKYALLSHKENLQGSARKNLKILLAANKRLNTAYVLKESFGQLWDYNREAWARKFFENWRDQLKWQRLKPYENFAEMIDTHWDGIAAYCKPENKVPLGFVEGLNNKIRVISAGLTGCVTRNTSGSKYSAACCRKSKNLRRRGGTMARRQSPATIRDTSHGGLSSPRARACQVRSRRRRWPERPDFTGAGSGGDNGT